MSEAFRGIKAGDYVLAGILTALGLVLMVLDVRVTDAQVAREVAGGSMAHVMSSHSPWMIPVFAAATVLALWGGAASSSSPAPRSWSWHCTTSCSGG